MFNTLYHCSRTITRHEKGPLYESRRSYLDTTQIYVEMDLEMKARALEKCDTLEVKKPPVGSPNPLMDFLRAI